MSRLSGVGLAAALAVLSGCAALPAGHTQAGAAAPGEARAPRLGPPLRSLTPEDLVRVGRYSAVAPGPTQAERHPLQTMVQIQYPRAVRTVGAALDYTLRRSGYRLAGAGVLGSWPLPEVHRRLGPMRLEQALATLAGPAFRLQIDERTRSVAFVPAGAGAAERGGATAGEIGAAPSGAGTQSDALAAQRPAARPAPSPETGALASDAYAGTGASYGPVRAGETAYPIAERLRAGTGASAEQMMLGLLSANPEAFGRVHGEPNVNVLRGGTMLYAPDGQALGTWSAAAARQEIRRQGRLWRRYRPHGGEPATGPGRV